MLKLGVLISGSGTNLQAIIDAIDAGQLDAQVVLVISSKPDAYGLVRAQQAGIPTMSLSKETYAEDAEGADEIIASELLRAGVDLVVMAGYMRMVRKPLLMAFPNRIVNLHPALLPSFPGAHGIADAFAAGVKWTGVTVHFANEAYDQGPIIAQVPVEIREEDTVDTLEERIHQAEHALYPQVLQAFAEGRISLDEDGRRVHVAPKA